MRAIRNALVVLVGLAALLVAAVWLLGDRDLPPEALVARYADDASRFVNWCRANSIEPVFKEASTGAATKRSRIRTYAPLAPF